jgi:hypothetical protein
MQQVLNYELVWMLSVFPFDQGSVEDIIFADKLMDVVSGL